MFLNITSFRKLRVELESRPQELNIGTLSSFSFFGARPINFYLTLVSLFCVTSSVMSTVLFLSKSAVTVLKQCQR